MMRFSLVLVAALLVACSSSPPAPYELEEDVVPTKPSKSKSKNDSGGAPTTPPPEEDEPGSSGGPTPGAGQCSAETTVDACYECCVGSDPAALDPGFEAFGRCACESPGVCAQQCGSSFCSGAEPSEACLQCLDGAAQCEQAADAACSANAACKAAYQCVESSGCDGK